MVGLVDLIAPVAGLAADCNLAGDSAVLIVREWVAAAYQRCQDKLETGPAGDLEVSIDPESVALVAFQRSLARSAIGPAWEETGESQLFRALETDLA